eukprot:scaffold39169_cov36-Tisochrysis_lutea.AAC.1
MGASRVRRSVAPPPLEVRVVVLIGQLIAHAKRQSMRMTDRPTRGELEPQREGTSRLPMCHVNHVINLVGRHPKKRTDINTFRPINL